MAQPNRKAGCSSFIAESRFRAARLGGFVGAALLVSGGAAALPAQGHPEAPAGVVEDGYRVVETWGQLPDGRQWGAVSGAYPDSRGDIWILDRCGANSCLDSGLDPVLQFDAQGNLLRSFGAGEIVWPHGFFVDHEDNVWVTDAVGFGATPPGRGHTVIKFSPEGEILLKLGVDGIKGEGEYIFDSPNDVVVAPEGDIFIADGHGTGGNNRVVKYAADGTFISAWGTTGTAPGQFREPHAIAMDSQGRVFVGDRYNNRVQIFDQEGEFIAQWSQFGRPSGIFITPDDRMYVADSESNTNRNPGWQRGIRIGSAATGWVDAFILDPEPDPDRSGTSGSEFMGVDVHGNIYGAEVGPRNLIRYEPVRR